MESEESVDQNIEEESFAQQQARIMPEVMANLRSRMDSAPSGDMLASRYAELGTVSSHQTSEDQEPLVEIDDCPICLQLPVMCLKFTSCEHRLCAACFQGLCLGHAGDPPCPLCREPMTGHEYDEELEELIKTRMTPEEYQERIAAGEQTVEARVEQVESLPPHMRHVMERRLPRPRNRAASIDLDEILRNTGNMESNSSQEDQSYHFARLRREMDAANQQERQRNPDPIQQLIPTMVQMVPRIMEMITNRVEVKKYSFAVRYIAYTLQMIALVLLSCTAFQGQSGTWLHTLTPLFTILYGFGFILRELAYEVA